MKSCQLSGLPLPAAADLAKVVATARRLAAGVVTCLHNTKAVAAAQSCRQILPARKGMCSLMQSWELTTQECSCYEPSFKNICVHLPSLK